MWSSEVFTYYHRYVSHDLTLWLPQAPPLRFSAALRRRRRPQLTHLSSARLLAVQQMVLAGCRATPPHAGSSLRSCRLTSCNIRDMVSVAARSISARPAAA